MRKLSATSFELDELLMNGRERSGILLFFFLKPNNLFHFLNFYMQFCSTLFPPPLFGGEDKIGI